MKIKRGGKILGYDSCPYLIILGLNVRMVMTVQAFMVMKIKYKNIQKKYLFESGDVL